MVGSVEDDRLLHDPQKFRHVNNEETQTFLMLLSCCEFWPKMLKQKKLLYVWEDDLYKEKNEKIY